MKTQSPPANTATRPRKSFGHEMVLGGPSQQGPDAAGLPPPSARCPACRGRVDPSRRTNHSARRAGEPPSAVSSASLSAQRILERSEQTAERLEVAPSNRSPRSSERSIRASGGLGGSQRRGRALLGDARHSLNTGETTKWGLALYYARMTDRRLPRGAAAVLGAIGVLLLVVASRTDGYVQALLINLGTGVLLFVGLEHALYAAAERLTTLVRETLKVFSSERWPELWSAAERLSLQEREALERELQATSPLPTETVERLRLELEAVDQMHADEHVKRMSYLAVLIDKYGVTRVRQVLTSVRNANPGTKGGVEQNLK
jgi:hypothetical protein